MQVERLPDLPIPLTYHHTLYLNNEAVVVGGHTDGFVPVRMAYCLHDGRWQEIPMVYTHDNGLALPLRSGKVLVAGGFEKDFGIGQSYAAEVYDPVTHTFESVSILDTRRAMCGAVEVDSGRVVVSGNWYHDDCIEQFDGRQYFFPVRDVTQSRFHPFLFLTAPDDVAIVGGYDLHGESHDTIWVDHLRGEPTMPLLLQQWRPLMMHLPFHSQTSFIGDETRGRYDYLMPVADSTGQVAVMQVRGGEFSLLATDHPVPKVEWLSHVIADRQRQRAYMMGQGSGGDSLTNMLYVLQIDYARQPARLMLHYAERPTGVGNVTPVLTPNGDLLMAGGMQNGNFHLYTGVVLLRVGDPVETSSVAWWLWLLLGGSMMAIAAFCIWRHRHRRVSIEIKQHGNSAEAEPTPTPSVEDEELMRRICDLMESERSFLNSSLKVSDVSDALGISSRRISDCIKACCHYSFAQFINGYRVEYAQQLLLGNPDMKTAAVWTRAGFANETSFFRTFKAVVGMTPKEWLEQNR